MRSQYLNYWYVGLSDVSVVRFPLVHHVTCHEVVKPELGRRVHYKDGWKEKRF